MNKRSLKQIELADKKVLVRVDFNVPMDKAGNITDDTRIEATLPTIRYLLEHKAAIILMAHLGRPKGKVVPEFSLGPVAKRLSELLGVKVQFATDCVGPIAESFAAELVPGQVLLLENLRFYGQEEKDDAEFAAKLAKLADIYVNDGFGVSHRAHASVHAIAKYLPAVAGLLLEKEIRFVGKAVDKPEHPFAAIIGGAKVTDKIGVIDNLLNKVDTLIIGGGMANTFLAAQGYNMGKSLVEEDKVALAATLITKAKAKGVKLLLPVDVVVADKFAADAKSVTVAANAIPDGWMALDIGAKSQQLFAEALVGMKTIVWNGPMGVFEMDQFAGGTEAVAKAVANSGAVSIVGGGDSTAALEKTGMAAQVTHISTGGGASLEYLEGKILPGIAALDEVRKPVIAGNWKMHKMVDEALTMVRELTAIVGPEKKIEVVVCPAFTALYPVGRELNKTVIGLGAQDMYWEAQGAYTGEIAPNMLKDVGCGYVILGHSERRQLFGETNETVGKKVKAALAAEMIPILCVGETLLQREAEMMYDVIASQIEGSLAEIVVGENLSAQANNIILAYEPIWAIGTGKTASAADAQDMCSFIRQVLAKIVSEESAEKIRILYGGSVKPENIAELMAQADIDGALVGGASLKPDSFAKLVQY